MRDKNGGVPWQGCKALLYLLELAKWPQLIEKRDLPEFTLIPSPIQLFFQVCNLAQNVFV